ncbi:signal peptidase II [Rhodohalobacter sp. 614A]|uniref:signal peptidase II n=1 Tax=Rhodohalobacter sp. 614A TaxID=2908649 RepID=UPI001F2C03F9|nr:signal peptidase II [Rhodohalobacter sp. 614A]
MSQKRKKIVTLFVPIVVVLILDQISKYWVRTTPELHRFELIEGWLQFNFTKNPGMALGMDWLSTPVISSIAIVATIGILTYVLFNLKQSTFPYLMCMGLILGGALGNITDRIFMGIVGGYGGVLDGHVVDFIHFDLMIGETPVFPYIFNVADVAISTSIIILILFHKKIMPVEESVKTPEEVETGQLYFSSEEEFVETDYPNSESDSPEKKDDSPSL